MPLPTTNLTLDAIHVEVGGTTGTTASLNDADIRGIGAPDSTYAPSGINTTSGTTISMGQFRNARDVYNISNSLKVEQDNNEWLYRTAASNGTRTKFTFSFWFKRSQITGFTADPYFMSQGTNARFHFANNTIRFMWDGNSTELEASGQLVDTSAWYHIVLAVDTTQATASNRVKAYLNGEAYEWNNSDWPTQNSTSTWLSTTTMYIGTRDGDGAYDNRGYFADFYVIDGQQLTASDFGEFDSATNIWKPKAYSGTYGTNGFYLNFSNASSLGADSSGNGNNFTLSNISSADQATDTPTNTFCNFETPVTLPSGTSVIISEGGTKAYTYVNEQKGQGNMTISAGKWYFEMQVPSGQSYAYYAVGFGLPNVWAGDYNSNRIVSDSGNSFGVYSDVGWAWGSGTTTTDFVGWGVGDIVMFAMDADNGKAYMGKNGSWAGSSNPANGTGGFNWSSNAANLSIGDTLIPVFRLAYFSGNILYANWGGYTPMSIASGNSDANGYGTFEYAPPSGYYAMCTKNLAEYG